MPRRKSEQMTPLELEIMQVLWETGRPQSRPSNASSSANWLTPPCRQCSPCCTGRRR